MFCEFGKIGKFCEKLWEIFLLPVPVKNPGYPHTWARWGGRQIWVRRLPPSVGRGVGTQKFCVGSLYGFWLQINFLSAYRNTSY